MRETLLEDAKDHAVLNKLGITLVFIQLAHEVEILDEELLPLHLRLANEIRPEYDMRKVDSEHLKLVLRLILSMLDEDFVYADVIFPVSELPLQVDDESFAHLNLRETRLELGHLWILGRRGWQVPSPLYPEVVVQQDPILQTAQEVRDRHLELLQLLINDQGVQYEL
jgi:hypothetical protein